MYQFQLKLLLGLGNPGWEYQWTRHNIGFLFIDAIVHKYSLKVETNNSICWWAKTEIARQPVILAKPLTYMNLSGRAASWLLSQCCLTPNQLLIIHDDLDLPWGRLKLIEKGGSGGHKGVISVQQMLGTKNIPRLKIGIGRPPAGIDTVSYVLGEFSPVEKEQLNFILDQAIRAVEIVLTEGLAKAMSVFNKRNLLETSSL